MSAREEFGGASADETIRRLLDAHWEAAALAAVERYRPRTGRAGPMTSPRPTGCRRHSRSICA